MYGIGRSSKNTMSPPDCIRLSRSLVLHLENLEALVHQRYTEKWEQ